jgi:hypothetical protein
LEFLINEINTHKANGFDKPIITQYPKPFWYDGNKEKTREQKEEVTQFHWKDKQRFKQDRIPMQGTIQNPKGNIHSISVSAGSLFTEGEFLKPNKLMFFDGEELLMAARAYTHGYDIFQPHKVVCWHEYTRKGRTKQWDDDKDWSKRNDYCHLKNRKLFEMDGEKRDIDFGKYGFGNKRTLRDYERYSGLCFGKRAITQQVKENKPPPDTLQNSTDEEFDTGLMQIFKHCIDIQYSQVPENDYDFWVVAFHDEKDDTIYRRDADTNEIHSFKNDPDGYCKVWREFQTHIKPKYWVVWPHSISKGWCERITGNL